MWYGKCSKCQRMYELKDRKKYHPDKSTCLECTPVKTSWLRKLLDGIRN